MCHAQVHVSYLRRLSQRARDKRLKREEIEGGTFTLSSLGGVGGQYFTPIINAPEVAILGICPARLQPVWQDGAFVPRLMLPLSLSYDHRVIDGAAAARFMNRLKELLADVRRLLPVGPALSAGFPETKKACHWQAFDLLG